MDGAAWPAIGSTTISSLDAYDYLTFVALIVLAIAFFAVAMFVLGLPGKIAERRNHPHAEAVKLMGWVGFLAIVPWIHALIWAYHDGVVVDVRSGLKNDGQSGPAPEREPQGLSQTAEPPAPPKT